MMPLHWKERAVISVFLALVFILVSYDLWMDRDVGASSQHMGTEAAVAVLALAGIALLWAKNLRLTRRVEGLGKDLAFAKSDALNWKTQNDEYLKGLGEGIQTQLKDWGLSEAECEIALFLIKGLSLKEIAHLRKTSERTVRQQSLSIYSKSGLSGRAELAAFFLEDLLAPIPRQR